MTDNASFVEASLLVNDHQQTTVSYSSCRSPDKKAPHYPPKPAWFTSKRWCLSYLMFFGSFFLYALRVNLSVAVVCMANTSTSNTSMEATHQRHAEFHWSEDTKSSLLSSYFYGYLVLQIPAGWLAARYGGSRIVTLSMILSASCSLLLPIAARHSLPVFYTLRVLIGLFAGATVPSFQTLLGCWAPAQERTKLAAFSYSGGYLGSIATFAISGVLCEHGFDGGWPSIFYITGGLAFMWALLWHALVYDSPSSHPTISEQEKDYIISSLPKHSRNAKSVRIPWRGMFTSAPFWSLIVAIISMAWVDYTFMTSLPQYLKDVLNFDITEDGVLTAVPSICQFTSSLFVGTLADYIRSRGVSTGAVRNIFQSSAFLGVGLCLTGVGYITHDKRYVAVALLGVSGFFAGVQQAGYVANFIDIAPRFAGVMYGIGNSMATVCGFVSPLVVGAVTSNKTRTEWQSVFYACAAVCLVSAILFVCFSDGKVQPWATEPSVGQAGPSDRCISGAKDNQVSPISETEEESTNPIIRSTM